ncbi:type I 3-dehydroquinate dehydratase [Sporolactobacillus sp. THM7-7]|nr:type I 3-dehydroquinate dehydratase [Sporolactobacillus sp. THM7-7]
MRTVKVRNIEFGRGIPKIAAPVVAKDIESLQRETAALKEKPVDLVEWRADFFEKIDDRNEIIRAAKEIRRLLVDKPLLFTFRTAKEGGQREIEREDYIQLNTNLIKSGQVDFVDVELFSGDETVSGLVETAHKNGVRVIISNHDFDGTPSTDTMVFRFKKMQELGADLTKIAVMPKSSTDVVTLLKVTDLMKTSVADRPFITMSMSGRGVVSRLTGELFGSAVTFGSAGQASAPGQIEVEKLADWLQFFHQQLNQ